jgi:hypothetical protein
VNAGADDVMTGKIDDRMLTNMLGTLERETGIEPVASSLGSSQSPYLVELTRPFYAPNEYIKQKIVVLLC